jgi:hypothetical protein
MEEHDEYLFFTIKHGSECCHVYATLEEFLAKVPISWYHPAPTREIIEECDFGESTHIIGPWYNESKGNDFQLAVTGKPNTYENITQGIIRELGEEIGATPNSNADLRCRRVSGRWTGWTCDMKSGMTLNTLPVPKAPPEKPDRKNRVLCVVHTTEDQVLEICQAAGTHLWPSSDKIDGIVAVPIDAARRIVKMKAANAKLGEVQISKGSSVAVVGGQTTGVWGGKPPTAVVGGQTTGGKPPTAVMGNQTTGASDASGGDEWTVVPEKKKKKKKKK